MSRRPTFTPSDATVDLDTGEATDNTAEITVESPPKGTKVKPNGARWDTGSLILGLVIASLMSLTTSLGTALLIAVGTAIARGGS